MNQIEILNVIRNGKVPLREEWSTFMDYRSVVDVLPECITNQIEYNNHPRMSKFLKIDTSIESEIK